MNDCTVSISKMKANGNRLELPQDNFFPDYAQVKKILVKAGGKYRKNGFDFPFPAIDIKDRLCNGEEINDKKKFQFFPTPDHLADRLIGLAKIEKGMSVLEPSAGQGAIADKIDSSRKCLVELMPENIKVLTGKGYTPIQADFLSLNPGVIGFFDRIVANPPFTKNQDIDHVRHMYDFLETGGILVSIMSVSWIQGSHKKQAEFRDWLKSLGAGGERLDRGEFKESGTSVPSCIVLINK